MPFGVIPKEQNHNDVKQKILIGHFDTAKQ